MARLCAASSTASEALCFFALLSVRPPVWLPAAAEVPSPPIALLLRFRYDRFLPPIESSESLDDSGLGGAVSAIGTMLDRFCQAVHPSLTACMMPDCLRGRWAAEGASSLSPSAPATPVTSAEAAGAASAVALASEAAGSVAVSMEPLESDEGSPAAGAALRAEEHNSVASADAFWQHQQLELVLQAVVAVPVSLEGVIRLCGPTTLSGCSSCPTRCETAEYGVGRSSNCVLPAR